LSWLAQAAGGASREVAATALAAAAGSPLVALRLLQQGETDAYRTLDDTLDALRAGRCEPSAAMTAGAETDPQLLWTWLSLRAARETREHLDQPGLARSFAGLQREADRNRRLLPTPVRKDLLLQDWLIQWARTDA
jgi:Flp pilus assembly protein TadB